MIPLRRMTLDAIQRCRSDRTGRFIRGPQLAVERSGLTDRCGCLLLPGGECTRRATSTMDGRIPAGVIDGRSAGACRDDGGCGSSRLAWHRGTSGRAHCRWLPPQRRPSGTGNVPSVPGVPKKQRISRYSHRNTEEGMGILSTGLCRLALIRSVEERRSRSTPGNPNARSRSPYR